MEMTVKYLRHIQRHQASAVASSEPEVAAKFSAGYTECATEVIRYMDSVQCVAPEVRSRLECHLVERLRGSVPTTAAVNTVGGSTTAPAFTGISSNSQTTVNDVYARVVSSTTNNPEEVQRHYQTAVDLANMAAAVTAKEATKPAAGVTTTVLNQAQSFHRQTHSVSELSMVGAGHSGVHMAFSMVVPSACIPEMYPSNERYHSKSADIVRTHSMSPSHGLPNEIPVSMVTSTSSGCHGSHIRHRSESGVSQLGYTSTTNRSDTGELNICVNSDVNNNYREGKIMPNPAYSTNMNDYLSSFQRPLHIHIPDSVSTHPQEPTPSPPFLPDSPSPPPQEPTPSPPFLQPHVGYPHMSGHSHPTTVAGTTHSLPQTVLYGYTDYQTNVHNSQSVDFTLVYPAQYSTNSVGSNTHAGSSNSNDSSYNDSICRETIDRTQAQTQTNFSKNYLETISNYQTAFHGLRGTRATPSPPTLLPERAYVSGQTDQYYSNSHQNVSSREYNQDISANGDFPASFPAILSPNVKENYDPQSIRRCGQTNSNVQYSCNQHDRLPGYSLQRQSNLTTTSEIKQLSDCPAEQSPGNRPGDNGQDGMKGPCQTASAPSRQNDQSLSPPTLKKRLLLAQGSEGEWTTPRCNRVNRDKRHVQCDTGRVLSSDRGANPRLWRDGHESQVQLGREAAPRLPATVLCSLPVHAAAAEEGLWRPW